MRKLRETPPTSRDGASIARFCAQVLDSFKLEKIEVVEVVGSLQIADYFVVATAGSQRHLRAASDELRKRLREAGLTGWGIEGQGDARWILVDLLDVVVHLFVEESRQFYDLDNLWGDCPRLAWHSRGESGGTEGAAPAGSQPDEVPGRKVRAGRGDGWTVSSAP